jgi:hypothetical protein
MILLPPPAPPPPRGSSRQRVAIAPPFVFVCGITPNAVSTTRVSPLPTRVSAKVVIGETLVLVDAARTPLFRNWLRHNLYFELLPVASGRISVAYDPVTLICTPLPTPSFERKPATVGVGDLC